MKRLLEIALIAISAASLVACGSDDKVAEGGGKDEAVTLKVQVEEGWLPYYEEAKERVLVDNPDAKIEFVTIGAFDHLDTITNTDSTNSDAADVFALPLDRFYELTNNNVLGAIDAKAMAENLGGFKDFDSGIGGSLKVEEDYLAFPYNIETLIGYVNVENAKKAGVDTTKPIEFDGLGYETLLATVHDAWFGVGFANSAGLEFLAKTEDGKFESDVTKEFKELTDDERALFEILFKYWKEHNTNKTDLWDQKASGGYLDTAFNTGGNGAIRIDGPWAAPNLVERVGSEENLEVIPLTNITVNGNPLNHWKGGWALGVNSRIEENEAAMELSQEFIEEIVNPEFAKDLFEHTGKILENVEPSAYEGIDALNKKVIDATYASYEKAIARPLFTEYGNVWGAWQNALLSWSSTNPTNAEEAYKQAQASFEAMMATINQ